MAIRRQIRYRYRSWFFSHLDLRKINFARIVICNTLELQNQVNLLCKIQPLRKYEYNVECQRLGLSLFKVRIWRELWILPPPTSAKSCQSTIQPPSQSKITRFWKKSLESPNFWTIWRNYTDFSIFISRFCSGLNIVQNTNPVPSKSKADPTFIFLWCGGAKAGFSRPTDRIQGIEILQLTPEL